MDILDNIGISQEAITAFEGLFIALGIGLLLGLEREHSKQHKEERLFAGIRTFPIVAILGYLAAYLSPRFSPLFLPAAFIGIIAIIALAYLRTPKSGIGTTTEFSLMMAFALGALTFAEKYYLAVSIAVAVTALLSLKIKLHWAARQLSQNDIYSIIYFVLITALVLPLLPDKDFGPYGLFNLYKTWLIVSIFVTLNFLAYFLSKFLSQKQSVIITGVLGGFASSTATAWFFSRQSGKSESGGTSQAAAIILASSIMFPRLLIWLLLLNQELLSTLWIPISILGLVGASIGIYLSRKKETTTEKREISNPINFREALTFGAVYLAIQFLVGYAEENFGNQGIMLAAAISGLTDVDAITVSMAHYGEQSISLSIAAVSIVIAAIANTLVKYGFCLVFGNRRLKKFTSLAFLPLFVLGLGYIVIRLLGV